MVVTTGPISRAKLQSNHHHHHQHLVFTDRMPFLHPTTNVKAMKVKYHIPIAYPNSPGSLPTLYLTANSFWLPWECCHAFHQLCDASSPSLMFFKVQLRFVTLKPYQLLLFPIYCDLFITHDLIPSEKVLENTPINQIGVILHLLGCCSITHWLPLGGAAPT